MECSMSSHTSQIQTGAETTSPRLGVPLRTGTTGNMTSLGLRMTDLPCSRRSPTSLNYHLVSATVATGASPPFSTMVLILVAMMAFATRMRT